MSPEYPTNFLGFKGAADLSDRDCFVVVMKRTGLLLLNASQAMPLNIAEGHAEGTNAGRCCFF